MNTLIIYDSKFGNTEQIAKAVMRAIGKFGRAEEANIGKHGAPDIREFDLIVVGSPTQGWRPTPNIASFLRDLPVLNRKASAAFDTRFRAPVLFTGSAAKSISDALKKKGGTIIARPESFFVAGKEGPLREGELLRAESWASKLAEKCMAEKSI